ncbi:MAG: IclR family transcriptional regulator [Anaerolineales bacterium]|nr:IclR family transcriptional regulator [Anaerolineales bacterium]HEY61836.1 IclR family transcriptional regulator [Anaerolineae bacterium]
MRKQGKLIGSVQRALNILNLFNDRHPELGITDIANFLDLPKSTAAGLVKTLLKNNYLAQNESTRKYRLGFKIVERARLLLNQFDLRQIAHSDLEKLRNQCNESINLAVLDGSHVVYIERLHGNNILSMRSEIGKREYAHSTALGKAILANLPIEEISEFISSHDFVSVTPKTITTPVDFLTELQKIRQQGFAIDDEENEPGGRCVAAPIIDYKGKPIAAISISVPIQRMPSHKIDEFGALVKRTAKEISLKTGASLTL